jgi:alpha-tubulin suppressor-like RCC1 family protein
MSVPRPLLLLLAVSTLILAGQPAALAAKPAPSPPPPASAVLKVPSTADPGASVTATVTIAPVDVGRPVQLQRLEGSTWTAVASGTLPASGTVSIPFTTPSTAATYSYRASAPKTRSTAAITSNTATIEVAAPPTISPSVLPTAVVGTPYSFTFTTTDGRAGTWSLLTGAAPEGLALSTAGVLSGTPTAKAGDYVVGIRFTDTAGRSATASPTLAIRRSQPVITATVPPPATVGQAYSFQFTTTDGRSGLTWSLKSGSLPAGLTLGAQSGVVSGTPTTATVPGTNNSFTVQVSDPLAVTTTGTRTTSITVEPDPGPWSDLVSSGATTCGLRADGSGWCWGDNTRGTVGAAPGAVRSTVPARLPHSWLTLDLRGATACGVTTTRALYCWGANDSGQVGDGTAIDRFVPTAVASGTSWTSVRVGDAFTCGVRADSTGWCWGRGDRGQLGVGTVTRSLVPVQVPGTWGTIETGRGFACGIGSGGVASCWGRNDHGQVGDGSTGDALSPVALAGQWEVLSVGDADHACGYLTDETPYCWGANDRGQVGDGTTTDRLTPYQLPGRWIRFSVAGVSTCAIDSDGVGSCWGQASAPAAGTWSTLHVSPGGTVCGVQTDDTGWCWGTNTSGQVGDGTMTDAPAPVQLAGSWVDVFPGGAATTCGYRTDGSSWCWGENGQGQVGNGTINPALVPSPLP